MSRGSLLSPWDAIPYFQPVMEEHVFFSSNGVIFAQADPMRIYLGVFPQQTTNYYVSTVADTIAAVGRILDGPDNPMELFHYKHGNLVQAEWWGSSPPGGDYCVVIQVRLSKWPTQ